MERSTSSATAKRAAWLFAVLLLVFGFSGAVARFYTDVLWFHELGHEAVFWTRLVSKWAVFGVALVVAFVTTYLNVRIAWKLRPRAVLRATDEASYRLEMALEDFKRRVERFAGAAALAACAVVALMLADGASRQWATVRLALSAVPFGKVDPQFGRDLSFFFFTAPALRAVADWVMGVLFVTLLLTAAAHLFSGALRPWARLKGFDPHVKAHLSVLGGLMIVVQAFKYWLDIFELDFSPRGQVIGASYTDVHAQIPAYQILIVVAIACGLALIVNIRFRGWRLPAMALGVWVAASVLVGGVYPSLVQQFRVAPNEIAAEEPFIKRNIAMTRTAFGLDAVHVRAFPAEESLTATDIAASAETISNVRLWDPGIARESYQQLQGIRPYYDFADVDVDRYVIDGTLRQVLVAARELDTSRLAEQAKTWVNEHLVYTHGYGVVVSPVNEVSGQGLPQFIVRDIPPATKTDLKVMQPAVYFGELTDAYAVVDTDIEEFDYPVGDQNAGTRYAGSGGVEVGGPLRRLAFALRFSSPQFLLSDYIRSDSKVLFRRSLKERVRELAPWLAVDDDPYPAVIDGRIVWILDGYTVSDRYPYSERISGVNYIRNSVKITIDAYDGTTTFYAIDEADPLLATWRRIFPGLVKDASDMPQGVRAHLRYPEGLFRIQAEAYKTYHMQDPRVFYNKEDQWALPGENGGTAMEPFYVLMRLPQEPKTDFMMMLPFTPRNKDNMIGWMAASSDADSYGRRIVYTFPKQKLVLGPNQVSARINQDPTISQQLTLWSQRGSNVLFGNMLVIPIKDSIVYIQPLYLQAEQTAMPQLTRVIVAYGDKVAMQPDLPAALAGVFGASAPSEGGGETPSATIARAAELYQAAMEAQRAGDWAAYGKHIGELGRVLESLSGASGGATQTP
ncbi:UPF0182 family protein [Coriobacteriia bacterium Es71-Z0120]|uniref:UPF0182 family membrane protein n=1 Tax=Parvivirga hydrogeniphila TaxID=2939460 RepID=UPI002260FAA9|nr:UPF0182 family protein [Parvivirga hydrogeniphila]MCL4078229.1 UPF0182 family protein [Parvivirga hydrogeniphila]